MRRHKIIDSVAWIKVLIATISLCALLQTQSFRNIARDNVLESGSFIASFFLLFLIALLSPQLTYKSTAKLWNKITPIKGKPTFIETEIVYFLSAVPSITIIIALFLGFNFTSALNVLSWVSLSLFPAVTFGYGAHRILLKTASIPSEVDLTVSQETPEAEIQEDDLLDMESPNILAFLLASLVFIVTLNALAITIISLRVGFQLKIFTSLLATSTITLIILTLMGESALNFGIKIQKCFGYGPIESRSSIASAWTLGIMGSTTFFILIFSAHRLPTSLDGLLASWPSLVAYFIVILSCLMSGAILSLFYKTKPQSAVFA